MRFYCYFLLTVFIILPKFSLAQAGTTGSISGKIVDAQNNPIAYATTTLLKQDSSVVNGDLTKDDGSFKIIPIALGSYRLRIESIGIKTKFVSVILTADKPDLNLGKIKIAESENTLKEVSVVGERPVMELKVDKKVFNVEKNTTTAGGSATDVLQNVPSVSVDNDGNVALRGKTDVTILIDGKPSTLLGSDVASALQSLPANSIESVEVITNPSAKYDAQGSTGIINIITKKDGRFGMNGNVTLGMGEGDRVNDTKDNLGINKYNGNFGINARKGKWNVFLNSSFRVNNSYNDVITDRYNKNDSGKIFQSYHTYENVPRSHNAVFSNIGASYDPNKYNSFTLTENVNLMQFAFKDYSTYSVYDTSANEKGNPNFLQQRNTNSKVNILSLSTALDYKHKFKKKDEELNIDGTISVTNFNRAQDLVTNILTPNMPFNPINEHAPASGINSTTNIWADYTDPLTKNGKLGIGFKSQFYLFNSSGNTVVDSNNRTPKTDSTLIANYNYTQQILAGYINWSDQINKFSYQAGLRLEDAVYDGSGQTPTQASYHNSFLNLFPSAFVSYQLPMQQSIYLNYSRRTNRPDFRSLLPFKDLSNPGTVSMGNPNLIPEFINNIEFSYSKATDRGDNLIFSTYYSVNNNLTQKVTRLITPLDSKLGLTNEVGKLLSQPVNITSGTTYGVEGTGHIQMMPIWDATFNLNFFQNDLNVSQVDTAYRKFLTNDNGFTWFGKINTNLKLPKGFSIQANANYESPKVIAQGHLRETYWIDLAVKKTFWKNKATLVINCSDILKTHTSVIDYNLPAYNETINRIKETRVGNISFTYRFGKSDLGKSGSGGQGKHGKPTSTKIEPPTNENRDKNLKDSEDGGGDSGGGGNGGGQTKDK